MRGFIPAVLAIALLSYVVTRSEKPPATPAAFAELSTGTKSTEPAKSEPRSGSVRSSVRSAGPTDFSPKVQQPAPEQIAPTSPAPAEQRIKRTTEILTVAAIAALIVEESRRLYHARGRPCACPDDLMRNGRTCGGRSAYSRPGGAAPLCYPTDVTEQMIKDFRTQRLARE